MADGNGGGLNEKDRIGIMLEEYKALRAEIVARTTMQAQLTSAFGAGVITVICLTFSYHIFKVGPIMIIHTWPVLLSVSFFERRHTKYWQTSS